MSVFVALLFGASANCLAEDKGPVLVIGGEGLGEAGGLLNTPRGGAVNVATGDVYVADASNNRIQRFGANGAFKSAWGLDVDATTPGTGFEICTADSGSTCKKGLTTTTANGGGLSAPQGVAIDQSTGDVYVSDQGNRRIQEFGPAGEFIRAFGWDVVSTGAPNDVGTSAFEVCDTTAGNVSADCKQGASGANAGQLGLTIGQLAVGPGGNVFVADPANRRVQKFGSTGVFQLAFGWNVDPAGGSGELETCPGSCQAGVAGSAVGQFSSGQPTRVAVDSGGAIYTVEATGNSRVQKFTPAASAASVFAPGVLSEPGTPAPTDVAVDPTNDHVFVVKPCSGAICPEAAVTSERRVKEFDNSGTLLGTDGVNSGIAVVNGMAVNPATGDLLLTSTTGGHRVYVLNSRSPSVAMLPVTTFAGTTATLEGEVNPNGLPTGYHFEYSTDGVTWTRVEESDASAGNGTTAVPVTGEATGLTGSQAYQVRLVATSRFVFGSAIAAMRESSPVSFTTAPAVPAIDGEAATLVTETSATLNAEIASQNQATSYSFEYVDDASFAIDGYADAVQVPSAPASLPASGSPAPVSVAISGLTPGTVYHFRVSASNGTGPALGADHTFSTFADAGNLPTDRGWEMVSPVDKNGSEGTSEAISSFATVQVAPSGDSIAYPTLVPLPEATSGTPVQQNVATRTPDGWSSISVSPTLGPAVDNFFFGVDYQLSEDLTKSVVRSSAHLTPEAASIGEWPGIYLSEHATQPFAYTLLSDRADSLPPHAPPSLGSVPPFAYEAATRDLSHVVFDAREFQLIPDGLAETPNSDGLYVWSDGALEYASVVPVGIAPAQSSVAGATRVFERANFPGENRLSSSGRYLYFTVREPVASRGLYRRDVLEGETDIVSASERTGDDPSQPVQARFEQASLAGTKAFFSSEFKLTDDATASAGAADLYRWNADAAPGTRLDDLTTADPAGARVIATVGGADDGSSVFFVARGSLVAGAVAGEANLYRWQEGSGVELVAGLSEEDAAVWSRDASSASARYRDARVAADGGSILFASRASLTPYETAGTRQLYLYRAGADAIECVSCNPRTVKSGADASLFTLAGGPGKLTVAPEMLPANLSGDGKHVFFETLEALVLGDSNGLTDVYEWEAGHVQLVSDGSAPFPSAFIGADPDGDDAFFITRAPLVGIDRDTLGDVYDARVGGGIAAQAGGSSSGCEGDACQGAVAPPPQLVAPASAQLIGPADRVRKRPPRCRSRKGHRAAKGQSARKRGKCSKPRKRHSSKSRGRGRR